MASFFGLAEVRKFYVCHERPLDTSGQVVAESPPSHCRVDDAAVLSFKSAPLKVLTIATMSSSCVSYASESLYGSAKNSASAFHGC